MSIMEYFINSDKKCHECKYFKTEKDDWYCGECICENNKIKKGKDMPQIRLVHLKRKLGVE